MEIQKLLTVFLPAFVIFVVTGISAVTGAKELMVIGLLLIFPILFLGQGAACGFGKAKLAVSLAVSTLAFFIVVLLQLNSSAIAYIALYLFIALFSYVIALLALKKPFQKYE